MRRKRVITASLCTAAVLTLAAAGEPGSSVSETHRVLAETQAEHKETGTQTPVQSETAAPAQTESQAPVQSETAAPAQTESQAPVQSETAAPVQTESQAPVQSETAAPTQTESQAPVQSETAAPAQTESQAPVQTETAAPAQTEGQTSVQTENTSETLPVQTELQSESGSEPEDKTETETETETEPETSKYASNEELVAAQNIVVPPEIRLEFRFTQTDPVYAIVSSRTGTQVYEEKSETSRAVGALDYYGLCCILENTGDGWYYIESRNVRGFVKAEDTVTGETADRIVRVRGEGRLPGARLLVARTENAAFGYTHTTTQPVIADKVYALARGSVNIYEQRKTSAAVTGILSDGALCYVLADGEKDWIYVESGDARGFVQRENLITGSEAASRVAGAGENNLSLAQVLIEPEENLACYYTLTSVKAASQSNLTREAMVNFALQFVGNPYVWGGTSLTAGADCSGFVQSVYANFGYSIPRVADAQSVYGTQIPISSAQPGDLIFYARKGYVYHVSMYIGNGQVVQAANSRVGIITSGISQDAVWATRILPE